MDRDQMLGPATEAAPEGESFIEEHDRRWGRFGVVGIGLACYVAFRVYSAVGDDIREQAEPDALAKALAAEAETMRPRLPLKLDELTTLTAVTAEGRRLIYEATVAADVPSEELAAAEEALAHDQTLALCRDASTRRAIDAGALISYRVRDTSGDVMRAEVFDCRS